MVESFPNRSNDFESWDKVKLGEFTRLLELRLSNVEYTLESRDGDFFRGVDRIVELLGPVNCTEKLVRIGNQSDGGYVIAELANSKGNDFVINLGVGTEVSADIYLLHAGFSVLAVDGTVGNPLPDEENFEFVHRNIGYSNNSEKDITYRSLIENYGHKRNVNLLLVDIEGFEYSLFQKESELLTNANQIVIEFHALELLGDPKFRKEITFMLQMIRKSHSPIHIHGNNAGGSLALGGCSFPCILEVTFLKNSYCTTSRNFGPFPGELDFPNIPTRPDIDLTPLFGLKPDYAILPRNVLNSLET
jgi:hypothetical protein